jgi:hypothetical protein
MSLTSRCLDDWMEDYDSFFEALMRCVQPFAKSCGYSFEHDSAALKAAHAGWVAECKEWETSRLMKDSNGLSHLKILAILMDHLAKVPWIKSLHEFDFENSRDARHYEFPGTADECVATKADINAGRGAYLGYQFSLAVVRWFEAGREDKIETYAFRMTPDLEHDFLVYLLSEKRDAMAVYLFLMALFVRADKITVPS